MQITAPASPQFLAAALHGGYGDHVPFWMWQEGIKQLVGGPSWSVIGDDGELLFIGGLYRARDAERTYAAWFIATPALASQVLGAVRAIRRTIRVASLGWRCVCHIDRRRPAGARLARLCGFEFLCTHDAFDLYQIDRRQER